MKNIPILIMSLILVLSCNKDNQETSITSNSNVIEKIFVGSLINPSNIELQNFYNEGYTIINGDVKFIKDEGLITFVAFSNVRKIEGSLFIENSPNLTNFNGLEKLEEIGNDFHYLGDGIDNINNIDGISNLKSIGRDLYISSLFNIDNLHCFKKLEFVGRDMNLFYLTIINVDFLKNITTINGNLLFYHLHQLENITGLSNIETIDGDLILGQSLTWPNNSLITNLNGLEKLKRISGNFHINYQIQDFCAIKNLITTNGIDGQLFISSTEYTEDQYSSYFGNCTK